jgi:exodeoxyribonuclease VII large subunit
MSDTSLAPQAPARSRPNLPEFTVTELSAALRRDIEQNFSYVRVRGEISGCKKHSSGHCYLTLKDADAVLDSVIWRTALQRLALKPEDGMEVVCTGRLTTYPSRSKYQLVIENIDLAGIGALLKVLEDRRKRLAAEGLFDAARKRKLPFLPEVIGIVTSPSGAVIRDILHRLKDRFARHVLLWPVPVQGEGAAQQIADAIAGFNRLAPGGAIPRPDLIIVARGGGSLEDLMAFNEEVVVRAAAASAIPLISAVGHETDTTLIDYASDRRAPTPTAAAEMAVPVRLDLVAQMAMLSGRLAAGMVRRLNGDRLRIEGLGRGLPDPLGLIEAAGQRLDDRAERLELGLRNRVRHAEHRLRGLAARVNANLLRGEIERTARRLAELEPRLRTAAARRIAQHGHRLESLAGRLESYYQALRNILARGYAIVRDSRGRVITEMQAIKPDQKLSLEFHDGKIKVFAEGKQGRLL